MRSLLLFVFNNLFITYGYKPVFLMHGIMTGSDSMSILQNRIEEKHPGTIVYNTDRFGGWSSLEYMWYQVQEIGKDLMNLTQQHPEGMHLIGHSQGALLARTILQNFTQHNVDSFISLSGPQAGQYGTNFLHLIFPDLALKSAFELFYSRVGQHTSVGNYWNDPHHQALYTEYSQYLPYVNNELSSPKSNNFKKGIVKLSQMILIGGPDDNVITPWESSQFGYYGLNGTVQDLIDRDIYKNDLIGLKTLDSAGKLHIITVAGIDHFSWHTNASVIDAHILPYLS